MLRIVYAYFPRQSKCSRIACVIWNDKPHQRLLVRCRIVSSKPRFRLPAISCADTVHKRGDRLRETTSLCRHTCRHSEDSSGTSILLLDDRLLDCRLRGLDSGFGSSKFLCRSFGSSKFLCRSFGSSNLLCWSFDDRLLGSGFHGGLDNRLLDHWLRRDLDGLLGDRRNLLLYLLP